MPEHRNPRAEATAQLPDGYEARVLEPSPPANTDPDWYADDPTDPARAEGTVVSPVSDGDLTWDEHVRSHPELAAFAADRWLGAWKPLQPLPDGFAATRDALHQLAFFALAPWRHAANGKLGLRWTLGGFGTPFTGADNQVRVEGTDLVRQTPEGVEAEKITTVRRACEFLGIPYREVWFESFHDPLTPADPDATLAVDAEAIAVLSDWFGFATSALEELRRIPDAVEVSRVQLWPEHFDPAVELGSADRGQRASYGASPGDAGHADPYLYVSPWGEVDDAHPFWNGEGFGGAILGYAELLAADDPHQRALDFYREGHRILTGS